MRESKIEDYLCDRVKKVKGQTRKVQWVGRNSAPDRIVFLKGAHFVEVKATGEVPRPDQVREHKRMKKQGVKVWIIDTYKKVDDFIDWILKK